MSSVPQQSIGSLLREYFSGAWGVDPKADMPITTVLRSTDIDDEGHTDLSRGAPRLLSLSEQSMKQQRAGDVLLEASGGGPGKPVGRPAWFSDDVPDGHFVTSNFFKTLRVDQRVANPRFLLWSLLLLSKRPEVWRFQQQTTGIINLKFADYLEYKIRVPSLAEQRRIAEILDAVDDQIRATGILLAKIRSFASGVTDRLLDDSAQDQLAQSSWHSAAIGEICDVQAGITLGPHRRPRRGSVGYLRVANVQRSSIDVSDIARLQASAVEQARYRLCSGDLLVVEGHADVNQIGRCARVEESSAGLLYQNHLFRIRTTQVDPVVAEAWLNSRYARRYWRQTCSSSSGLNTINSKQLRSMRIIVPPLGEQRQIADTLLGLAERVRRERDVLDKLTLQKAGLMADLLFGRVRVPRESNS